MTFLAGFIFGTFFGCLAIGLSIWIKGRFAKQAPRETVESPIKQLIRQRLAGYE